MKKPAFLLFFGVFALLLPGLAVAETTRFDEPMQGRFRLDYCRFERVDCGVAAAFAFCQQEGYSQIVHFNGERDVRNTQRIGDGVTCRANQGATCDGFEFITCTRDGPPPVIETGPGSVNYPARPDFGDDNGGDEAADE
jgi:hypothetical protein